MDERNYFNMSKASKYKAPFRVGKKQKRAILDYLGHTVVVLRKGDEELAAHFCRLYNGTFESQLEYSSSELADILVKEALKDNAHLEVEEQVLVDRFSKAIEQYLMDARKQWDRFQKLKKRTSMKAKLKDLLTTRERDYTQASAQPVDLNKNVEDLTWKELGELGFLFWDININNLAAKAAAGLAKRSRSKDIPILG